MKTLLIIVFLFSAPSTVFGNQDNYSEEQVAEAINSLKDYRESKTFVFRNTSKGMMKYGAITATSGLAIAMAGRGIISIGDKMFLKAVRASYGTATQVAPSVLRYSGKKFFKIVLTGSLINAAGRVAAIAGTLTASLGIGIFAITPSTANASEHTNYFLSSPEAFDDMINRPLEELLYYAANEEAFGNAMVNLNKIIEDPQIFTE